ncbi:MAG: aromatic amino acid transaminase [Chlamydiales bacterium]|nr:aromatic amino acid transaminase [Chlamydiales bacterium]
MFNTLTLLPSDPIYGMQAIYKADNRSTKINLSIGICLDNHGKLLRFKAVHEAEKRVFDKNPGKEYLPITGHAGYTEKAHAIICGQPNNGDFFTAQTVGGTGALFIVGQLLAQTSVKEIFIPDPSWPNHKQLFSAAGLTTASYPYYNKANISLDFDKMLASIHTMPENSAIILQASCHNPTGIDPTISQWQELSQVIKAKKILPVFDLAYMGLGDSLEEDTKAIRLFIEDDHNLFICTTFAKSLGIYNDRVGLLSVKLPRAQLEIIASHIRSIARTSYSSPPAHGALVANEIFGDEMLTNMWKEELAATCQNLQNQRQILYDALKETACKIPYEHLLQTKGLFCLLDCTPDHVIALRENHGIYIALDGRISLAAITKENVKAIAKGLEVL